MKIFLKILTIIIVIGGIAGFIYGWVTLFVPPDTYCVAFSKTNGFDTKVIEPGKFTWRWERLIPTNMTLYKFLLKPYSTTIEVNGKLPSAEVYSSVMPEQPDFSYNLKVSVSVTVNPEKLPYLVKEKGLRPDNFDKWFQNQVESAVESMAGFLQKNSSNSVLMQDFSEVNSKAKSYLKEKLPYLVFKDLSILSYNVPDITLYAKAKEIYFQLADAQLQSQKSIIKMAENKKVEDLLSQEQEKLKLEQYREYGKLLTEYPILLKFFALKEGKIGKLNLELPEINHKQ